MFRQLHPNRKPHFVPRRYVKTTRFLLVPKEQHRENFARKALAKAKPGEMLSRVSNRGPLYCHANESRHNSLQTMPREKSGRANPSAASWLTQCFVHSFSYTKHSTLTAVNFKQLFSVCFSNFVYSESFPWHQGLKAERSGFHNLEILCFSKSHTATLIEKQSGN